MLPLTMDMFLALQNVRESFSKPHQLVGRRFRQRHGRKYRATRGVMHLSRIRHRAAERAREAE